MMWHIVARVTQLLATHLLPTSHPPAVTTTGTPQPPSASPLLTLLGIMPGASMGSFQSISHMGPSSGGSRLRSMRRIWSRVASEATGGPPCT